MENRSGGSLWQEIEWKMKNSRERVGNENNVERERTNKEDDEHAL